MLETDTSKQLRFEAYGEHEFDDFGLCSRLEGKHPKYHIEAGIDIKVSPVGDNSNQAEFIFDNSRPGKYYPGCPESINVPYFRCSWMNLMIIK